MTRRTARRAATGIVSVSAFIATGWLLLWASTDLPTSTVIFWATVIVAVVVAGVLVMLRTAGRHMDPFAPSPGTADQDDPDEHMRPLRVGAGRTANRLTADFARLRWLPPLTARTLAARKSAAAREEASSRTGTTSPVPVPEPAPSPSVPVLTSSEEEAPTIVPGRESAGPPRTMAQTPAGGPAPKRTPASHRRPATRRQWRAGKPVPLPVVTVPAMVLSAPPPETPEGTPVPGSEPASRVTGQGPATEDEPFTWAPEVRETIRPDLPAPEPYLPDGLDEPDWHITEDEGAYCVPGCPDDVCRSMGTCAWTARRERMADTGEIRAAQDAAPVPAVDHEPAPEESAPTEAPPSLPEDQDCPGPLFPDWKTGQFAAFVEAGEAQ